MHYEFNWSVLYEYRYLLLTGLQTTLELTGLTLLLSAVLGVLIGTARHFVPPTLGWPFAGLVEFFRNVPAVVQLFFWYFAVGLDLFPAAVVGLSIFSSAYFSEVVRSGYRSIPRTQTEAARASGLNPLQMIRYVMLPQCLMRMVPALSVESINVLKNSSLAMTIGVAELTFQSQEIGSLTFRGFEAVTAATIMYVALVALLIGLTHTAETFLQADVKA